MRSSEAVCRTALDLILNEVLTVMVSIVVIMHSVSIHLHQKGNQIRPESQDHNQCTPTQWDTVKIFGDFSFSHTISRPSNKRYAPEFVGTNVNGRVDRGIGRFVTHDHSNTRTSRRRPFVFKQRFQCLLLIVEAKTAYNLGHVIPQLVVYMGSIHQSRRQQNRRDATVYGAVSDGYSYTFVTITHDGVLKQSKLFEVPQGDTGTILGCIKYILGAASSNVTLEGGSSDEGDSDIDIDDTGYTE